MRELQEWERAMVAALDDATIRSIVSDLRGGVPGPSSIIPEKKAAAEPVKPTTSKNGWVEAPPLRPQWGLDWAAKYNKPK
jgi:hypothetical protein